MARPEQLDGFVGVVVGHDATEAAAHVEGLPELRRLHLATVCDELEQRRNGERLVELESNRRLQPEQVQEALTGDVSEPPNLDVRGQQLADGPNVDHGGLEE